ncbi:hypothetical protein EDC96DRAFT_580971 [Choanephora cucurbitarum]|nr:hypothetical protein EDC96DRAFT_580971 [Choanephora cucurbitarum]
MLLSREATDELIRLVFNVKNTEYPSKFCDNCSLFVKHEKVPRLCLSNGLKLPEIPEEIKRLKRIEERLVAARHVFQSILTVLGVRGQYKSKGVIVNVPVSVDKTVSCIPRLLNDTNIIQVKLKRRFAQANCNMSGNDNIFNVWATAHVLKDSQAYKKHNLSEAFAKFGINIDSECDMEEEREDEINSGGAGTFFSGAEEFTIPIQVDTEGLLVALAEGSRPMRFLFDKDVEYLAFPTLFGGAIMERIHEGKPI